MTVMYSELSNSQEIRGPCALPVRCSVKVFVCHAGVVVAVRAASLWRGPRPKKPRLDSNSALCAPGLSATGAAKDAVCGDGLIVDDNDDVELNALGCRLI